MIVAVVDYGSGNLRSAAKALERAGDGLAGGCEVVVTSDPEQVARADRIVLPGVGAFGDCRRGLEGLPGMIDALETAVRHAGRPFLGICVGMQLMAERGLEHGDHPGLGWIPGEVVALQPVDAALKIPHMGWNELILSRPEHPVLAGLGTMPEVYFVHSYELRLADPGDLLAQTDYGGVFAAIVGRDNMAGTQFHPEKSQRAGLRMLANFLEWRP